MMATHFPPAGRLGRLLSLLSLSLALAGCLPQPPAAVQAELSLVADQGIQLDWVGVSRASHYRVLENIDGESGFNPLGDDLPGQGLADQPLSYRLDAAPLHRRLNAQYLVQSCNSAGCTNSPTVSVSGNLATAISYLKASNSDNQDQFGFALALSADGRTLAVGAPTEASLDNPELDPHFGVGAVYVFQRCAGRWREQALLKPNHSRLLFASKTNGFGSALSLNAAGTLLAVGQPYANNGNGIKGGYVQLYRRSADQWREAGQLTAGSDSAANDRFGLAVSLNPAGTAVAVAAPTEESAGDFDNPDPNDASLTSSGAVYLFVADTSASNGWCACGFIKSPTPQRNALFGTSLSLVGETDLTLAVGDGLPHYPPWDEMTGQVHLYRYQPGSDTPLTHQQSLVGKEAGERFGQAVQLSQDGRLLAVGAPRYGRGYIALDEQGDDSFVGYRNAGPGRVQLFQYNSNNERWQSLQPLTSGSDSADGFGQALAFSPGGDWLAVGAIGDDHTNSRGVMTGPGNSALSPGNDSGAVFLYQRDGDAWRLANYLKAPNPDSDDWFGEALALSADGQLAVAAIGEDSDARGVGGDANNDREYSSGAVYLY